MNWVMSRLLSIKELSPQENVNILNIMLIACMDVLRTTYNTDRKIVKQGTDKITK